MTINAACRVESDPNVHDKGASLQCHQSKRVTDSFGYLENQSNSFFWQSWKKAADKSPIHLDGDVCEQSLIDMVT